MHYQTVVGLEVHAQLSTKTKIFCGCPTTFGAEANTQGCPVCAGMPGVLPVLNRSAVEYAMRMALAIHSAIQPRSIFARKNYFYPDLPKGYQISQFERPFAKGGHIEIEVNGRKKHIRLVRIHLEEDAGKSMHGEDAGIGGESLVDINRCGVPLIEIVGEPDIASPEEAAAYLTKVRQILMYLRICDGNMEQGNLRTDVNVNMHVERDGGWFKTPIAEIKNLNSFRYAVRAIEALIEQQKTMIEDGALELVPLDGTAPKETLLWDETQAQVRFMRAKEQAHDYRYFPEPDLVPFEVDPTWIEQVRKTLPELPDVRRERLATQYRIPAYDAEVLTEERDIAEYYEAAIRAGGDPKAVSNWVMGDVLRELNRRKIGIADVKVPPERLVDLLKLMQEGTISGKIAKTVFEEMAETGEAPRKIIERRGLVQISDAGTLEHVIEDVLQEQSKEVARYRAGATKLLGFFVGQVMRKTKGKANPKLVNQLLKERLRG